MRNAFRTILLLIAVAIVAPGALAKKATSTPPPDNAPPAKAVDASKAELSATLAIANIKLGRAAIAEDASLADVKDTVAGVYDREESAMKSALAQLRAAADAKAKSAAVNAVNAADDEATAYFTRNPSVNDKIKRRVGIINTEIGDIARSPSAYLGTLAKVGVSGDALAKAKAVVDAAAAKSNGKTDGDNADTCLSARSQVHQMMSARQLKLLDAQLGGK